jgi:Na+/H+ antiporter NhaD/arsenite permease-like protein
MTRETSGRPRRRARSIARVLACVLLLAAAGPALASAPPDEAGERPLGETLPLWSALPFAGILLSIALFPLVAPHFWHHHYPKISIAWAVIFAAPFLVIYRAAAWHEILHIYVADYIPFIILLWGLFTVSGGIVVRGTLAGTPAVNTALLAFGTLIASWVGTTGASMLLIRPVLRANAHRKRKVHIIVFFIFLVANIGGCLTPLGDPPLFLGFLHGVPFFWTLHLFPQLLVLGTILLALFYFLDRRYWLREGSPAPASEEAKPLSVAGLHNLAFLAGILGAVMLSGMWEAGTVHFPGIRVNVQNLARDVLIVLMGFLSLWTTSRALRVENGFSWEPIREVAYLFAGIFMTIVPALAILKAGGRGALAGLVASLSEPREYFWVTGLLSSFLDNAPTFLTFFNSELGLFYPGLAEALAVPRLIAEHEAHLLAVAAGAVFMGANTYIGNAPNFMVKSIAEEAGVPMPSFFGYLFRWSVPILFPLFVLLTILFF